MPSASVISRGSCSRPALSSTAYSTACPSPDPSSDPCRTATETLRHGSEDGSGLGHAVEYAVLDRAGRLQLPREMTEALDMRDRVRLEAETDHIGVWPDLRDKQSEDGGA